MKMPILTKGEKMSEIISKRNIFPDNEEFPRPYEIAQKEIVTNLKEIKKDILETKKRGYSIDYREGDIEVSCVAAPIYQEGKIFGAISLAGLYTTIDEEETRKRGKKIKETAEKISEILN